MYTSFRPGVYVWEEFDFWILDNFVVYKNIIYFSIEFFVVVVVFKK